MTVQAAPGGRLTDLATGALDRADGGAWLLRRADDAAGDLDPGSVRLSSGAAPVELGLFTSNPCAWVGSTMLTVDGGVVPVAVPYREAWPALAARDADGHWTPLIPAPELDVVLVPGRSAQPAAVPFVGATMHPEAETATTLGATAHATAIWRRRVPWGSTSPLGPGPLFTHSVAFDRQRGHLLILGGAEAPGQGPNQRTWVWSRDGFTDEGAAPGSLVHASAVFHAARGEITVFGGENRAGTTLIWNGRNWHQAPGGPPARARHAMAYDQDRGRTLVFGGFGPPMRSDVWEWDGRAWTEVTPDAGAPGPGELEGGTAEYSTADHLALLYGGSRNAGTDPGLWGWSNRAWQLLDSGADGGPGARWKPASCFDERRGVLVVHGGSTLDPAPVVLGDTWEWRRDQGWKQVGDPARQPRRDQHAMTWDSVGQRCLMYGGADAVGGRSAELWSWDGVSWRNLTPAPGPSGRFFSTAARDPSGRGMVLVGGDTGDGQARDTWLWDDARWQRQPGDHAIARKSMTATAAPFDGGVMALGGAYVEPGSGALEPLDAWKVSDAGVERVWSDTSGDGGLVGAFSATLADGTILVTGGQTEANEPRTTLTRQDICFLSPQRTWTCRHWRLGVQYRLADFAYAPRRNVLYRYGGESSDGVKTSDFRAIDFDVADAGWRPIDAGSSAPPPAAGGVAFIHPVSERFVRGLGSSADGGDGTLGFWQFTGDSWEPLAVTWTPSAEPRFKPAFALAGDGARLWVFGGRGSGDALLDHLNELDLSPGRQPAWSWTPQTPWGALAQAEGPESLQVVARCAGQGQVGWDPDAGAGALREGAALWVWHARSGQWRQVAENRSGFPDGGTQGQVPAAAVVNFSVDADGGPGAWVGAEMGVQCRPRGTSQAGTPEASVSAAALEVRMRYRFRGPPP